MQTDKKILIVDDSRMIRLSVRKLLASYGFDRIIEADDGDVALAKHREERPDLIIMDVVMPRMRGDVALGQIRQVDPNVPVVMLSSLTDDSSIEACRKVGITAWLPKPLTPDGDSGGRMREILRGI
jgi:two-component system chemotaxis response regulator CheY